MYVTKEIDFNQLGWLTRFAGISIAIKVYIKVYQGGFLYNMQYDKIAVTNSVGRVDSGIYIYIIINEKAIWVYILYSYCL